MNKILIEILNAIGDGNTTGAKSELARRIGVTPQAINNWIVNDTIPVRKVILIEAATGGRVTRHQICPEFYPLDLPAPKKTEEFDRERQQRVF